MLKIIPNELRERYFKEIIKRITNQKNRKRVLLSREWVTLFPSEPGVYCFFENNILKYVGETGNIRARMRDMLNTKNHNLRRLIGEYKFSNHIGYEKASSKKSFNQEIENKLCAWMRKHLEVSCLAINIGRKEFEDWVQDNNP